MFYLSIEGYRKTPPYRSYYCCKSSCFIVNGIIRKSSHIIAGVRHDVITPRKRRRRDADMLSAAARRRRRTALISKSTQAANFAARSTYTVSQKTRHPNNVDNFAKYLSIFKILSLIDSEQNFLQNKYCTCIAHHTLQMLLHYLVKLQCFKNRRNSKIHYQRTLF